MEKFHTQGIELSEVVLRIRCTKIFIIFWYYGKGVKVIFLSKGRGHTFSRLNYVDCFFPIFILFISIWRSCSFCVTMSRGDSSSPRFKSVTSKSNDNFAPCCANASMYHSLCFSSILSMMSTSSEFY